MKGIVLTVRIALLIMVSILINSKAIQAAELKDEVIKELTSDLTELSKMIQPKVATAKNFPPDQIVVGTVEDLTSDWLTAAKKAGFSENATIATMSKAFKENSFVMTPAVVRGPTKFLKVEGKPDQLPLVATIPLLGWLFKKDQQVAINDRTIAQVAMSDNF